MLPGGLLDGVAEEDLGKTVDGDGDGEARV